MIHAVLRCIDYSIQASLLYNITAYNYSYNVWLGFAINCMLHVMSTAIQYDTIISNYYVVVYVLFCTVQYCYGNESIITSVLLLLTILQLLFIDMFDYSVYNDDNKKVHTAIVDCVLCVGLLYNFFNVLVEYVLTDITTIIRLFK